MISLIIKLLLFYFSYTPFATSTTYTIDNATEVFKYFKEKYDKSYKNANEDRMRLENFVFNLNTIEHLNEIVEDKDTFYIINQHSDLNAKELSQHYAINIKPYYKVANNKDAEYLGRSKTKEIKTSQLYDLDKAEDLYKEYMLKYKKKNATKKFDRQIHFYRFVKTLVELNNKYIQGDEAVELDDVADVLKEPNEYFWPND